MMVIMGMLLMTETMKGVVITLIMNVKCVLSTSANAIAAVITVTTAHISGGTSGRQLMNSK